MTVAAKDETGEVWLWAGGPTVEEDFTTISVLDLTAVSTGALLLVDVVVTTGA